MHSQLWRLLFHECGKWCIWVTSTNVVNFVDNPFDQSKKNVVVKKSPVSLAFERFPFNSNTLIGYSIAALLQYLMVVYEYVIFACTLSLGIGAFCWVISATTEIRRILHKIRNEAKANNCQPNEMKLFLSEFIYAHVIAKKLSEFFNFQIDGMKFESHLSHISNLNLILHNWIYFPPINCFLERCVIFRTCFNQFLWRFSYGVFQKYVPYC